MQRQRRVYAVELGAEKVVFSCSPGLSNVTHRNENDTMLYMNSVVPRIMSNV